MSRLNFTAESLDLVKKLAELGQTKTSIDPTIKALIEIRASQMNGCTFCVDMHVKEAKIHGERELRLHHVAVWRESKLFTDKERAALEWTELVTRLAPGGISDQDYERALTHLSKKELSDLTFMIGTINVWNRINVAFHGVPGTLDKMYGLEKAGLN
ncbi:carboxymuconolactone decarboxylase family protein [Peredibacter starrii]|uniref:Carboxymuconolactone decarboxylase family protein n=1 Tax=Peredibacter starrii TaxID=28202 RepID=A0AAX4HUK5_9BACT|nr:carboxymuconolactone decarboxylase family protein [Peredibacter starrii]WPU66645.1 carboxymuconolactone decarboxylase family protein [Peredibacter starrii]